MKNEKTFETLDEMLFENRNKDYGAYFLRKNYSQHLTKALLIGVVPILLLFLSSFLIPKPIIETQIDDGGVIIILDDWKELIPEQLKVKDQKPIVKQEEIATKVIPTEVVTVDDTKAIMEAKVPTETELENVAIGTKNQEGKPAVGSFNAPSEIEQKGVFAKVPEPPVEPEIDKTFISSEVMPEFEGGVQKMYKWLGKNLRYPTEATSHGIQGRVIVTFIVEKNGKISNVEVLKGIGFGCDEEAERVIAKMPNWNAGLQNGKPVRVRYTIPLNFQITR